MSQLDLDKVYTRFTTFVADTIGDKLAKVPSRGSGTNKPAVFKYKDNRSSASYPYVLVNISNINAQNPTVYEMYNTDTNSVDTYTLYDLAVLHTVYSTSYASTSAEQLAFNLHAKINTRQAICDLASEGLGQVKSVEPIFSNSFRRDNEVGESSSFIVNFTVSHLESVNVAPVQGIIMNLEGKYTNPETTVIEETINITNP